VSYAQSTLPGTPWVPEEMVEVYSSASLKLEVTTRYSDFARLDAPK